MCKLPGLPACPPWSGGRSFNRRAVFCGCLFGGARVAPARCESVWISAGGGRYEQRVPGGKRVLMKRTMPGRSLAKNGDVVRRTPDFPSCDLELSCDDGLVCSFDTGDAPTHQLGRPKS